MRRCVGLWILIAVAVVGVAGCGATPEPTVPPPTQTPWIVIITSTPQPEQATPVQATQIPQATAAGPTRTRRPTPTLTGEATIVPGATGEPTEPPASPTATRAAAVATSTATPGTVEYSYSAPILLDPPRNMSVSWNSEILLKWTSVGELRDDEYYAVELYRAPRPGMDEYGDTFFVKRTEYLWRGPDKAPFHPPEVQGTVAVDWWVRVVRKTGETPSGKPMGVDISLSSERWPLILDPKPEGQ